MKARMMEMVENIYQLLHAGDVSLAVKINADSLHFVSYRRWLRSYRMKTVAKVPLDEKIPLGTRIVTTQQKLGIRPNFTTIQLPQSSNLLKKIAIPLMSANEITGYLYQHANRLLLPGISAEKFSLHYKILQATATELSVLVLLQHRHIVEKYLQELMVVEAHQVIAGNTVLDNLLMVYDDQFTGVLVDICNGEFLMLLYQHGNFSTLYSGSIDEEKELEAGVRAIMDAASRSEGVVGEYHYIISGKKDESATLVTFLEKEGFQPLGKKLPFPQNSYLSTAAAGLNPFFNREDNFDMLDGQTKQRRRDAYYQHLLKKSMLLAGGMLLLLIFAVSALEGVLERAVQARNVQETSLQPLIRERDTLHVNYTRMLEKIPALSLPAQRQSKHANYLYQIAESLPKRVWLTSAEISPAGEEKLSIQFVGLSPGTEDISQWMQLLEAMGFSENVMLLDVSLLEREKIKRKWRLPYQQLTQFRIRLDAHL